MKANLSKGRAALVSGPASVNVMSGAVSCLGARVEGSVIVRKDKRLPFLAEEDSVIDLLQGPESSFLEAETDTIPSSWYNLAGELSSKTKSRRQTVLIAGEVDSGKTTLTVFLANLLYANNLRIAVMNLDVGQSDLGPPTTVGIKFISHSAFDLFLEKPDRLEFVGSTTPTHCRTLITRYASELSLEASKRTDAIIVNTDGWIHDPEAIEFKTTLLKACHATAAVLIGEQEDLSGFTEATQRLGVPAYVVQRSRFTVSRTRDERRRFREQSYRRYLEYSVPRVLPASLVDGSLYEPVAGRLLGLFDESSRFAGLGVADRMGNGKLVLRTPFRGRVARVLGASIRLVDGEETIDNNESLAMHGNRFEIGSRETRRIDLMKDD